MDKMLRAQIAGEVRRVLMEVLEGSQEQWVSADELGKHISFCTKDWLRLYGSTLPRTRAMVTTPDGETHQSAYTYPLHKIQRMLANNEVKFLKLVQYEKGFKKDNGNAYAGHYSSTDCSLHRSVQ